MNRQASINLDALRIAAAGSVFICHFSQLGMRGDPRVLEPLGRLGVVAFFVLSGYVIDHVAKTRHHCLRDYAESRLARLASVFLPALLLTFSLDAAGRLQAPGLYARYPAPWDWRTLASLPVFMVFLHENGLFSLRWLSNGPMWSIAYEFWYYAIFGVAVYLRGRQRALWLTVCVVLAGWKVLLMMPIWLAGVMIRRRHWFHGRPRSSKALIGLVALLALAALCTPVGQVALLPLRQVGEGLPAGFHTPFLSDMLCAGPVVALVALATSPATSGWHCSARAERLIRAAANSTFSLYLLHVPVILWLRSTGYYDATAALQAVPAALVVLAICYALSRVTEARKDWWLSRIAGMTKRLETDVPRPIARR